MSCREPLNNGHVCKIKTWMHFLLLFSKKELLAHIPDSTFRAEIKAIKVSLRISDNYVTNSGSHFLTLNKSPS